MQVSSRRLNRTIESQIYKMLFGLMADIKDPREVKTVMDDLLTSSELTAMAKRLAIAVYLDKGRSYEDIKNHLKVSSATIASVAEQMGNPGVQSALNRIKAEQWADEMSGKISNLVKKFCLDKGWSG